LDTVTSELQFIPTITNIQIKLVGGVFGFFADQFDVTFTYTGDGSDTAANIIQPMLDALNGVLASFDFVGITSGDTGVPTEGTDAGGGAHIPEISTTTIALVVVGIALVVFLVSGGPSLVRGASGA